MLRYRMSMYSTSNEILNEILIETRTTNIEVYDDIIDL